MRAFGKIGLAETVEVAPDVWDDVITEHDYIGDVVQRTEALSSADTVVPNYSTSTSVSVLSGGAYKENYRDIRYITYQGINWTVVSIVMQYPRMILYLGEEWHGNTPAT